MPPGPSKYATGWPLWVRRRAGKCERMVSTLAAVGCSVVLGIRIVGLLDLGAAESFDHLHRFHVIGFLAEFCVRHAEQFGGELENG